MSSDLKALVLERLELETTADDTWPALVLAALDGAVHETVALTAHIACITARRGFNDNQKSRIEIFLLDEVVQDQRGVTETH